MRAVIPFLFALLFSLNVFAQGEVAGETMVVTSPSASIYSAPDESKKTATVLNRGRRVQAAGPEENGFLPLSTKSGGRAWINVTDLEADSAPAAADVYEPAAPAPAPAPQRRGARQRPHDDAKDSGFGLKKVTFDLGVSTGSVSNIRYTEANLGFNLYFAEWLAWRNAIFARFVDKLDNVYGLDSSVRGIFNADGGALGFTAFAGPGYRFVNGGNGNVPFGEAGLVLRVAGIALGGGVKTLFNSWVRKDDPNDTQYFFILSGGGSL